MSEGRLRFSKMICCGGVTVPLELRVLFDARLLSSCAEVVPWPLPLPLPFASCALLARLCLRLFMTATSARALCAEERENRKNG